MLLLLAVSMLAVAFKIQPASADGVDWWPMFHHDPTHTGYSTSTGPSTNNTLWTYNTGSGVDSPSVVGGFVYVGSDDGQVYCLNAITGALVWNYTTGAEVESSPAVVGGLVYVGSDDDNVYCLNATNGALVWNYTTGSWVESSPAVVGGFVYVGSDDCSTYCLNATSGAFVWSYRTGGYVGSSPAVAGGLVYVGSEDNSTYCLNATSGAFVWSYRTGGYVDSSPAVAGGLVYVGSDDCSTYCLNATSGAFVWSYTTGYAWISSPAVVGGLVYVGSVDCSTYCLNAATGAPVWSYPTIGGWSSPAVVNGVVYVESQDGNIYAFGPSLASHDVSIEGVIASKSVVGSGYSMSVNVTAADLGGYTETFNVTAYANATVIGSENIILPAGNSTTVTFTWNTDGFAYGDYTISAYALLVLGETNTGDNGMTGGTVYVGIPGDVDGIGRVNMNDIVSLMKAFGSTPGQPNWNPNCDINGKGRVDMSDVVIAVSNFGRHYP
jgi:outer membrane protein assembly factor BamB